MKTETVSSTLSIEIPQRKSVDKVRIFQAREKVIS